MKATSKSKAAVNKVIAAFGSQSELADALRLTRSAVNIWKRRGYIPRTCWFDILEISKERRLGLKKDIFI